MGGGRTKRAAIGAVCRPGRSWPIRSDASAFPWYARRVSPWLVRGDESVSTKSELEVLHVGEDHAVGYFHEVLISIFPSRVTVDVIRRTHEAHHDLSRRHPDGTATLALIGSGIPVVTGPVRAYAAEVARLAPRSMRGECLVIHGHGFWVATARTALRAIRLASHAVHPQTTCSTIDEGARWTVGQVRRPAADAARLSRAAMDLDARFRRAHR